MRTRYVQDPDTLELVEVGDYAPKRADGLLIIPDIQPYQSVITGEQIGGRRQHREHLKMHDCMEIGNEKQKPAPMREIPRSERRDAIRRAISDLKNGKRPNARFG